MAGEIFAGVGAFKTMFDIAKSLKDMSDAVNRNAAVSDLWEQIIAAQTRYTAAIDKVHELEKELTRFETWDAEKKCYELKDLERGFFAYILTEEEQAGKEPHAICTNCYQRGFKSVLHSSGHIRSIERSWDCPACKTQFRNAWNDMAGLIKKCRETKV